MRLVRTYRVHVSAFRGRGQGLDPRKGSVTTIYAALYQRELFLILTTRTETYAETIVSDPIA
jgi:hypothetical protein